MIDPAVAASRAALALLALNASLIAVFYDLSFASSWHRGFFVAGLSALGALVVGFLVALVEKVSSRLTSGAPRQRQRLIRGAVGVLVVAFLGLWVDSFLQSRARTLAIVGALAILLIVVIRISSRPRDQRPPERRSALAWWLGLTATVLLCWSLSVRETSIHPPTSGSLGGSEVANSAQQLPSGTNLLLIVVDTLRGDHLGFEGYARDTSPTIDALAAEGVAFRGTTAQATRTSPSMASLMTSLTPISHGIIESRSVLAEELPTLGEILQSAGYRSAAIVANPMVGSSFGYGVGFEVFDEIYRETSNQIDAAAVVDRALGWLDTAPPEPFALWLHLVDPHTPYDPPEPGRERFFGDVLHASQPAEPLAVGGRFGAMPKSAQVEGYDSLRDYVALYDAEIRYTDDEIGRLLESLAARGLDQRTLVVLTSDHGESLGDHDYFFSHGAYAYESTSRVPLIFYHPQLEPPATRAPTPRLIDVVPSIAALLGLEGSSRFEGVNLFADTAAPAMGRVAPIVSGTADYTHLAVRTSEAKLILVPRHWRGFDYLARRLLAFWPTLARDHPTLGRAFRRELFDLVSDPGEEVNLTGQRPELERQLLADLLAWVRDSGNSSPAAEQRSREDLDREVERQLEALGYLD